MKLHILFADKDTLLKILNIIALTCDLDKIIFNLGVCTLVIVNILHLSVHIHHETAIDRNKWFNNFDCDIALTTF